MAATGGQARVLCIGESMVLVAPAAPSPLADAELFRLDVAGAESTVALYLEDLGVRSAWVSRVGDDPLGARVVDVIAKRGVDVSAVRVDESSPTGVYFKDPGDGATTVHYYRAGSAASRMSPADLDDLPMGSAEVVHISGITAALSESCLELVRAVLSRSGSAVPLVSFDVNFRPALWSATVAAPILAELAGLADIAFVGQDEAATLWGARTPHAVREVLPTPGRVVVKDGAIGATEIADEGSTFAPAEAVEVVEPVGAGDAFAAGYLAGTLDGIGARRSLEQGHRIAARTLTSMSDYVPGLRA